MHFFQKSLIVLTRTVLQNAKQGAVGWDLRKLKARGERKGLLSKSWGTLEHAMIHMMLHAAIAAIACFLLCLRFFLEAFLRYPQLGAPGTLEARGAPRWLVRTGRRL